MVMSKIKNWKDKENIHAAHGRMTRLFELIHYLMKAPRSVHEVAMKLGMNNRSAYRYFYTLENLGIPVDKEIGKDGKFFIAMDTCPVCGKNVEEKNIEHESTGEEREASPRAPENMVAARQDDNAEPGFKDVEDLTARYIRLQIETRLSPNENS